MEIKFVEDLDEVLVVRSPETSGAIDRVPHRIGPDSFHPLELTVVSTDVSDTRVGTLCLRVASKFVSHDANATVTVMNAVTESGARVRVWYSDNPHYSSRVEENSWIAPTRN